MILKMNQVVNSVGGLRELSGLKLPGSASLAVVRAAKQVDAALADFNLARKKLIEDFGLVADAHGNYPFPDEATAKEFEVEMNSILDSEVELSVTAIPFSKLNDAALTPNSVVSVGWLFDLDA